MRRAKANAGTIGMQKLTLWMILLALLSACDAKERDGPLRARLAEATFTTTSYNYTPYGLYSIAFKASGRPFNIDEAASGGSVLLRDASLATLDTGDKIPFTSGNCCIIWDRPLDQPLRVKVVWNVVIDPDYYDNKSSVDYDERTSTESAPGTRWCEAVIDIAPSKDAARPDAVVLHFFKDGSVLGQLASAKSDGPLSAREVAAHAASLPEGQFCKQEIRNPLYGIPRAPHRE
jgi:hypothetical protein